MPAPTVSDPSCCGPNHPFSHSRQRERLEGRLWRGSASEKGWSEGQLSIIAQQYGTGAASAGVFTVLTIADGPQDDAGNTSGHGSRAPPTKVCRLLRAAAGLCSQFGLASHRRSKDFVPSRYF
ncbi:hypothetical protein GQ53DRAFT_745283 [Thozetella sp. PMI_491]|nr:hypothetical protein GQ53DRAFT_745283 [Thozetella sp. PMI_491]